MDPRGNKQEDISFSACPQLLVTEQPPQPSPAMWGIPKGTEGRRKEDRKERRYKRKGENERKRDWRDGLAVYTEYVYCSCRGPGFGSQHPYQTFTTAYSSRGSDAFGCH